MICMYNLLTHHEKIRCLRGLIRTYVYMAPTLKEKCPLPSPPLPLGSTYQPKFESHNSSIRVMDKTKGGIIPYVALRNIMINIRLTGSHSWQHLNTGVFFLFFSFL